MDNTITSDFGAAINLSADRLSHAYIIAAPPEAGKRLADKIAAALVCSASGDRRPCGVCAHCHKSQLSIHPDIITVEKPEDKAGYPVEQIREIRRDAHIMPNEAEKKVYIITDAGLMNPSGQNALLKILEEPPTHAAFLLLTENSRELLATVRSRCVEISLTAGKTTDICNGDAEKLLSALESGSRLKLAEVCFELEDLKKPEMLSFIEGLRCMTAERLTTLYAGGSAVLSAERLIKILTVTDKMMKFTDFNVSAGHIIGVAFAELI